MRLVFQVRRLYRGSSPCRTGDFARHLRDGAKWEDLKLCLKSSGTYDASVTFDKISHVGHSYGSAITYALIATYQNISDVAVLTGFILNKEILQQRYRASGAQYASENDPKHFAHTSSGYVVCGIPSAIQTGFISSHVNRTTGFGGFDAKLLEYAFSIRQPFAGPEIGSAVLEQEV